MKKIFSGIICGVAVFAMIMSLTACNNQETMSDATSDVSKSASTESQISESIESSKTTKSNKSTESSKSTKSNKSAVSKSVHTHNFSNATCTEPAKCSCGATQGTALGHNYSSATCTDPAKCSCGVTQGEALGHSFNNGSCTRCGFVKFETLKFSGSNQGIVAENINLPEGQYRVLISFEGTDIYVLENYDGGWLNVHLNGDSYEKSFSSVDSGSAQATIIDGPVNNGYILIDGHKGNWEIIIEAFK